MSKTIKISLSPSSIDNAIQELISIEKQIEKAPERLTEEIVKDAEQYLKSQYNHRNYAMLNSDIELPQTPTISYKKTKYGYQLIGKGKDILYDEYGTGEQGKASGYENKPSELNDYNSGQYVSKNINKFGRHYWFYKGQYLEGIPAGKQFFNTRKYIIEHGIDKAKKKVIGDIL